jgi:hypothetical protein
MASMMLTFGKVRCHVTIWIAQLSTHPCYRIDLASVCTSRLNHQSGSQELFRISNFIQWLAIHFCYI